MTQLEATTNNRHPTSNVEPARAGLWAIIGGWMLDVGCWMFRSGAREDDAEGGAAIGLGLVLQGATVFFDNARGNGKAEPGARVLGGEEWIEQPLFHIRRDAFAGIGHFQDDHLADAVGEALVIEPGAQGDLAIVADAVRSVLDEIDQDLLTLLGVNFDGDGD